MTNNLKILIIEDSEDDALLDVIQIERGGYKVNYKRVDTAIDLKAALHSQKWDIILSDYKMPNFNGLEALSIVKECEKDIPFIIISGVIGEDEAVEAMKAGAHDYIMKDNLKRLLPAVEREIREAKIRDNQRMLEHKEKLLQEERLAHFNFLENMDKINRAIQGANDLEQMMSEVLDVVHSIFDSDRAYLSYPCDPEAKTWHVPVKKSKSEYSGVMEQRMEMPVDKNVAKSFRILLDLEGPVIFGPGADFPLPGYVSEQYNSKSYMAMALYPRTGKPWQFGIHQCSGIKIWKKEEIRLFHEIGRRLADGLTSLLMYRERVKGEAENRAIVNAVPDLLFRINKNGIILDCRKPDKMELYLPPEQLIGKAYTDRSQSITRLAEEAIEKAFNTNDVITFEYDHIINNRKNYYEARVIKLNADEALVVERDITEKKQAEEALRLSEDRFSRIFLLSPIATAIIRVSDNVFMDVNDVFIKESGYTRDEIIGCTPIDLNFYVDFKEREKLLQIVQEKEILENFEFRFREKSGKVRFGILSSTLINLGGDMHLLSLIQDITERKLAEKALLDSERKYRIVADNTYSWEFWADIKGNYIYCSPSCSRVTGYSAKEFIDNQKLKTEIIHPDYYSEFKTHLLYAKTCKKGSSIQFKIIHKNGSERWIEHICRPVYDKSGNPLGQRGSNRDITENKETERKILDAIITTEEKERNRFSQDLHDGLGPMLSTVKLYFEWLGETTDAVKRKSIVTKGMENINNAFQALRDISNRLSPRILNNFGLIPSMKYLIQQLNKTKKIKIHLSYDIERRYNTHLEVTLYRIFSELINNTIKYANAQKITIEISHNPDNEQIFVLYKDDGKGFNLNDVLKRNKGLGIQNIKQRIKTLDGKISFDTDYGKPLSVKIELPISNNINEKNKA